MVLEIGKESFKTCDESAELYSCWRMGVRGGVETEMKEKVKEKGRGEKREQKGKGRGLKWPLQ